MLCPRKGAFQNFVFSFRQMLDASTTLSKSLAKAKNELHPQNKL